MPFSQISNPKLGNQNIFSIDKQDLEINNYKIELSTLVKLDIKSRKTL